jgi:hypothetical protein
LAKPAFSKLDLAIWQAPVLKPELLNGPLDIVLPLLFHVHHHPPPPHPMDREPTKGDWGGGIEGYRRDWKWERDRKKKRECV